MIQQQFALRRGDSDKNDKVILYLLLLLKKISLIINFYFFYKQIRKQNQIDAKNSRVKAAESTDRKVKGLSIQVREFYLSQLKDALFKNLECCQEENLIVDLAETNVDDVARELEYRIFSQTKLANKYKLNVSNEVFNLFKILQINLMINRD